MYEYFYSFAIKLTEKISYRKRINWSYDFRVSIKLGQKTVKTLIFQAQKVQFYFFTPFSWFPSFTYLLNKKDKQKKIKTEKKFNPKSNPAFWIQFYINRGLNWENEIVMNTIWL